MPGVIDGGIDGVGKPSTPGVPDGVGVTGETGVDGAKDGVGILGSPVPPESGIGTAIISGVTARIVPYDGDTAHIAGSPVDSKTVVVPVRVAV
jgi:hypothetical protein